MAFVSIKTCKHDILQNVNAAREMEIAAYMKDVVLPEANDAAWQQQVYDLLWSEHRALRDQLPTGWMTEANQVRVDVQTDFGEYQVWARFSRAASLPPNTRGWVDVPITRLIAQGIPWAAPLLGAMEKSQVVRERYATVSTNLAEYLNSCKSLNEAVRHYPDLIHFVPERYVKKMNETNGKTPPKKLSAAEQVLQRIDTTVITSAAVAAKIGGVT